MADEKKKEVENTDTDFQEGLDRGVNGQGTSSPLIDFRSDEQKEAEKRGNEAGKTIKAQKDAEKEEDDS